MSVNVIEILDANMEVQTVATMNALLDLVGEVQQDPTNYTLLSRLKELSTSLATIITNTDQVETLLNAINQTIGAITDAGLTDDQLRAAPLALPTGASTEALQQAILSVLQGVVNVAGPLTNTQLRASPLALPAGAATSAKQDTINTTLTGIAGSVDGLETLIAATNTALSSVAVTGPLTSSQLASAGLASQTTLAAILSALQAQLDLSTTLWTDNSGAFYVRRDIVNASGAYSVAFTTPTGSVATPGAGLRPAANEEALSTETATFDVIAGGTGYSSGDVVLRSITVDQNSSPPTVVASFWLNISTGAIISAPNSGHIVKASQNTTITSTVLPAGASTSAKQDTANTSLSSILSALQGTLTVSGPLTNTQLRASALPVSLTSVPLPTGAATETSLINILGVLQGSLAVTGPLTNAQLRASAVPVSGPFLTDGQLRATALPVSVSALPLPSGASTEATLASILTSVQGTLAVSGPLTDIQLRASPVPVSGPLTNAQLRASAVPVSMAALPTGAASETTLVSVLDALQNTLQVDGNLTVTGALTDAELRATPVPVSGPLTDTQLRASAVPISASALPLPSGAATQTTLAAVLAALQGTLPVSGPLTNAQLRASSIQVSASALPLPTGAATETTLQAVADAISAGITVADALTNTQLRASPVPVSASALPLPTGAATETTSASILSKLNGTVAVSGPLTDVQLRASAVPISASALPLPSGAATQTTLASILSALAGTLAVVGPLTDAQLRASAVPISASTLPLPTGAATETTSASILSKLNASVAVTGPLTDTQLRASPLALPTGAATQTTLAQVLAALQGTVNVTGPLTNVQLRASPFDVNIASGVITLPTGAATSAKQDTQITALGDINTKLAGTLAVSGPLTNAQLTSAGLATQTTLAAILSAIQAQVDLATTLWTDDSGAFYVRRDTVDDTGTYAVTFTTPSGSPASPGAGLRPASNEESLATETQLFSAIAGGTGYSIGDTIMRSVTVDQNASPPSVVASFWLNLTTAALITAPSLANLAISAGTVSVTSSVLPTGAATATKQDDLANLIGAVTGSPTANTVLARLKDINTSLASVVTTTPGAASTSRLLSSTADDNATVVKASAGDIYRVSVTNRTTGWLYLKFYNKSSAPTSSDTPRQTFELPPTTVTILDDKIAFSSGISYRITGAIADADNTAIGAGDITGMNIEYT